MLYEEKLLKSEKEAILSTLDARVFLVADMKVLTADFKEYIIKEINKAENENQLWTLYKLRLKEFSDHLIDLSGLKEIKEMIPGNWSELFHVKYHNYSIEHKRKMKLLVYKILAKIIKEVPYVSINSRVYNSLSKILSLCNNKLELIKVLLFCNHIPFSKIKHLFYNHPYIDSCCRILTLDKKSSFYEDDETIINSIEQDFEYETKNYTRFTFNFKYLVYVKEGSDLDTQPFETYKKSINNKYVKEQIFNCIKDIYSIDVDEFECFMERIENIRNCDNINKFYSFHKKEKSHLIDNYLAYDETNDTVILSIN